MCSSREVETIHQCLWDYHKFLLVWPKAVNKFAGNLQGFDMFTTWLETQIGLSGLEDVDENDEESKTPNKIWKFRSLLHTWDIQVRSNIRQNILWVERCYRVVIGELNLFVHAIFSSTWKDTISANITLSVEIQKFANKRSLEAQASLVEEFKTA